MEAEIIFSQMEAGNFGGLKWGPTSSEGPKSSRKLYTLPLDYSELATRLNQAKEIIWIPK